MYVHIATSYITRCIVLWLSPSCIFEFYHIQFIVLVSFFNNYLQSYLVSLILKFTAVGLNNRMYVFVQLSGITTATFQKTLVNNHLHNFCFLSVIEQTCRKITTMF